MKNNKENIKDYKGLEEVLKGLKIGRATFYRWKKSGTVVSELAKRGVGYVGSLDLLETPEKSIKSLEKKKTPLQTPSFTEKEIGEFAERMKKKGHRDSVLVGGETLDYTEFIPTGIKELDRILGGGIACARHSEVYGKWSTGKTTMALQIAGAFRRAGRPVLYVDAERAVDIGYAERLGVTFPDTFLVQPQSMEEAFDLMMDFLRVKKKGLIVVDSIAALTPQTVMEGDSTDANWAVKAKRMTWILGVSGHFIMENGHCVLWVNQLRDSMNPYGEKEYRPGGNAMKYYASQSVKLTGRKSDIKETSRVITAVCEKNKVAYPYGKAEMTLKFNEGFV